VQRRLQQGLDASILEKPKTSELEQARIDAYNRSNQIDEDDEEEAYKEFMSNENMFVNASGTAVVAKEVLRKLPDDATLKDNQPTTREKIKSMFDNSFSFPGFNTRDIVVDFGNATVVDMVTSSGGVGSPGIQSPKETNIEFTTLNVPKLMDESINIPLDLENDQLFMVNFFDALDKARLSDRKLNKDDYIKIFGSEELYNRYNPLETESISTGDQLFKK